MSDKKLVHKLKMPQTLQVAEETTGKSVPRILQILERGIPVWKAEFQAAVNNADNVPENYFSCESNVASRNVQMWWLPEGLYCLHKGEYFVVPASLVKFAKFK